ncbi:hypothetical protein RJ639_020285 [Escallonia herrerae]|uniref:Uncharacterized protein n=1 Tax=Escallonia herrerae TaxID=1293975 RepID=A0AA88V3W6_9ASTE|nr:hypothetical protein RJ639_020285 [Escallonia herrerae]
MLTATRAIPDLTKVEPFNGLKFKCWQSKLLLILDIAKVDFVLTIPKPTLKEDTDPKDFEKEFSIWETSDKICKGMILNSLSNELYDVYCSYAHASVIWNALNKKYVVEDASTKKYAIGNFLQFQMSEEKDVSSQIHESHLVVAKLTKEGMPLPEPFVTGSLIEKLPESWSDYKSMMKHKRKDMTLEDVIVHIRIEKKNRSREKAAQAKEFALKANLIEERHDRPHGNHNRAAYRFLVLKSDVLDSNTIIELKDAEFFENVFPLKTKVDKQISEKEPQLKAGEGSEIEIRRNFNPEDWDLNVEDIINVHEELSSETSMVSCQPPPISESNSDSLEILAENPMPKIHASVVAIESVLPHSQGINSSDNHIIHSLSEPSLNGPKVDTWLVEPFNKLDKISSLVAKDLQSNPFHLPKATYQVESAPALSSQTNPSHLLTLTEGQPIQD